MIDWRSSAPEPGKAYPSFPQITINRVEVRNASSFAARIECPVTYLCDHSHGKRLTQPSRLAAPGTNQTPAALTPAALAPAALTPAAPLPPATPVSLVPAVSPVSPVVLSLMSHPPLATRVVGGFKSSWIITSPIGEAAIHDHESGPR